MLNLRVIISNEDHGWVAQCLDYHITAQAPTIKEVKKRFAMTIVGQIILDLQNDREPLEWLGSPPDDKYIYFENGEKLEQDIPVKDFPGYPQEIKADTRLHEFA